MWWNQLTVEVLEEAVQSGLLVLGQVELYSFSGFARFLQVVILVQAELVHDLAQEVLILMVSLELVQVLVVLLFLVELMVLVVHFLIGGFQWQCRYICCHHGHLHLLLVLLITCY